VWRPRDWHEVNALIGTAQETPSLDFKKAVTSKNEDIAKDIAAMTVNGGVLLYGVEEDRLSTVANAVSPVPLAGLEERLRSVAGSRIAPMPDFDVERIVEHSGDPDGVLAVVVPPSPSAPHQVDGRYPCRRGTTNDWLTEPEVDRLYAQRRAWGSVPGIQELLETDFVAAPGMDGVEMPSGVGQLELVVRPIATGFIHPAGAWQEKYLKAAVHAAATRQSGRIDYGDVGVLFRYLASWSAMGAAGWTAGQGGQPSPAFPGTQYAATMVYQARLSFQARWGLVAQRPVASQEPYRVARELEVIRDVTALLAIAGEYFAEVNGAGLLIAGARLSGFDGAKSVRLIDMGSAMMAPVATLPAAPDGVRGTARSSALALRDEPAETARELIERWLPAFYGDGSDPFREVVPAPSPASP
jgi:Putative DNA-binding domain